MENQMLFKETKQQLEVIFIGDIDHQTTLSYRESLVNQIDQGNYKEIILNFGKVTFIDSSGIGMVLGRYNQTHQKKIKLYLTHLNDATYRLFDLSGILKIIEIKEEMSHG